jgi:hypothetical protein
MKARSGTKQKQKLLLSPMAIHVLLYVAQGYNDIMNAKVVVFSLFFSSRVEIAS